LKALVVFLFYGIVTHLRYKVGYSVVINIIVQERRAIGENHQGSISTW